METPRTTKLELGRSPKTRLLPRLFAASSVFPSKILNPTFTRILLSNPPHPTPLRKKSVSKMSDQEKEPTPAELAAREAEEKQRKAAEEAEQAALPYKWTQTIRDVDVTISVPGTLKGRDLDVSLKRDSIRVAVKGQEAIIEVCSSPLSTCGYCLCRTYLVAWRPWRSLLLSYYRQKRKLSELEANECVLCENRAPSHTLSSSMNHPGRWRRPRLERKSRSIWTR